MICYEHAKYVQTKQEQQDEEKEMTMTEYLDKISGVE